MKISTKGRYSIRLMIDLALNGTRGFVLLKDVARRQGVSEKYLGHLVPLLKNAGLINATRGAKGGFSLNQTPAAISLTQIIEAVEGPLVLVDCVSDPCACKRTDSCAAADFWADVNAKMVSIFDSYTLEYLAQQQKKKQSVQTYEI